MSNSELTQALLNKLVWAPLETLPASKGPKSTILRGKRETYGWSDYLANTVNNIEQFENFAPEARSVKFLWLWVSLLEVNTENLKGKVISGINVDNILDLVGVAASLSFKLEMYRRILLNITTKTIGHNLYLPTYYTEKLLFRTVPDITLFKLVPRVMKLQENDYRIRRSSVESRVFSFFNLREE